MEMTIAATERGKSRTMIEYIANGMPTWVYVLIGIAVYSITRKLLG